jgi:ubiquinone/menaquinone biosynthesis C-methylase UbiE
MTQPNETQARYWNEQAGPTWVAMQRDLDAELEPFGVALLAKLGLGAGECVLDVGCGAGATSLMLAERVRPGLVLGVDISAPLLARARERAAAVENLRFEQADAQTFAFAAASFDRIFSRFGVMFFADPIAAFTNLRAALKTGGKLGFVCWRAASENPSFSLPLEAALPFLPEPPTPPPADAPSAFAFAEPARVARILELAGYQDVEITAHDAQLVYAGRKDLEGAVDLALRIGPLSRAFTTLTEAAHERVRAAVREAFRPHHGPAGVMLPAATWLVTARRGV